MWVKTYCHMKEWAPGVILKLSPKVIRKWPIHRKTRVLSTLLFFLLWVFATKPCQSRAPASFHTSASIIFSFSIAHSGPNGSQDKKVFNLEKVFHCDNFEKKSKKRQYIFNSFTVIGFSLMSDLLENKLSYNCVPYIIFLDPWSFNITFYSLKLRPSALSRKIIESKTHDALQSFCREVIQIRFHILEASFE